MCLTFMRPVMSSVSLLLRQHPWNKGALQAVICSAYLEKFNPELLPYGIYTIPEISMVGKTEQELTEARVPYEVGIAKYEELAKVRKECGSYWRQPNKIAFFSHALSISDSVERL